MTTDTRPAAPKGLSAAGAVGARLDTHEAVCSLRYVQIIDRLARLEQISYWAASILIIGMASVIATLLWHVPPH